MLHSDRCLLPAVAGKVTVNFHPELRVLIAEAHYLDRKGFSIPPLALQVALQQGEYRAWTESLERLLQLFYSVGNMAAATAVATACCHCHSMLPAALCQNHWWWSTV